MHFGLALLGLATALAADLPADFVLPPAPGPHAVPQPAAPQNAGATFHSGEPVVTTTYFYWYDAASNEHIVNADGTDALTHHPPTLEDFSYKSVAWHTRQLHDMIDAGIDVLLPVYWGTPIGGFDFSNEGLPPLVAAREQLLAAGKRPPAIGMFFDTSTLRHNPRGYHVDLTTPAGRRWFYGTIRNFFSLVPAKHRATIDGRPLVFLYTASFAQRVDEALFPAVQEMFERDFGVRLFLVKMADWPGQADSTYLWGGAITPQFLDTAALGPGYDHSAVPGRTPLVRDREDGAFYRSAWEQLLMRNPKTRPWLVHLETWNEFHEGTEICESAECGRQYIELTRKYAEMFRAGKRIDPARGQTRQEVSAAPGRSDGLQAVPMPQGDGAFVEVTTCGQKAWSTQPNRFSSMRYLYFDAAAEFLFDADDTVEVTVRYLDSGPAAFRLDYDSADPAASGLDQAFRVAGHRALAGTSAWREARFVLEHARFAGRANGADFRLACQNKELVVAEVRARRPAAGKTAKVELREQGATITPPPAGPAD